MLAIVLAGCGAGGGARSPDLGRLPLVTGTHVVAQAQECDRGASAYCAVELVVVDPRSTTSGALVSRETAQLKRRGWTSAHGDTGDERASYSPGQKLHVTFATAYGDLKGIDLGWIKRSRTIELALSRALFDRVSAMSMMLELGPK